MSAGSDATILIERTRAARRPAGSSRLMQLLEEREAAWAIANRASDGHQAIAGRLVQQVTGTDVPLDDLAWSPRPRPRVPTWATATLCASFVVLAVSFLSFAEEWLHIPAALTGPVTIALALAALVGIHRGEAAQRRWDTSEDGEQAQLIAVRSMAAGLLHVGCTEQTVVDVLDQIDDEQWGQLTALVVQAQLRQRDLTELAA